MKDLDLARKLINLLNHYEDEIKFNRRERRKSGLINESIEKSYEGSLDMIRSILLAIDDFTSEKE